MHIPPCCEGRLESEIRTNMKHMDANSPTKKTPPQVSTLRIRACALVNTRGSPGLQVGRHNTDYNFLVTGFSQLFLSLRVLYSNIDEISLGGSSSRKISALYKSNSIAKAKTSIRPDTSHQGW